MSDQLLLLGTFFVGIAGSFISAVAGAGVGLFTGYLILIGIPAPVAIGTARLGGIGLNVSAVARFIRSPHIRFTDLWWLTLISLMAGFAGAHLLVVLPEGFVRIVVAGLMLFAAPLLLRKKSVSESGMVSALKRRFGGLVLFCTISAQAAFGAGIGGLTNLAYMHFLGYSALEASATRRIPSLVMTSISLIIFFQYEVVDIRHGLVVMVGSLIGGYLGAHVAIAKGNDFVRIALALVLLALAFKILV